MEGTLSKWINFLLGWKQRYFILKSSILYISTKKGEKPKSKIHLAVTDFIKQGSLEIILDSGSKIIHIKAESSEKRDIWYNAMKDAKNQSNSKIETEKFKNYQEEIELGIPVNVNEDNFGTFIENVDKNSYMKVDYNSQRDTSRIISPDISPSKYSNYNRNSNTDNSSLTLDSNFLKNLKKISEILKNKMEIVYKNNVLLNFFISGSDEKKNIQQLKNEIIPIYYENKEEIFDAKNYIQEVLVMINAFDSYKESSSYVNKTPESKSGYVNNINKHMLLNSNVASNEAKQFLFSEESNLKKNSLSKSNLSKLATKQNKLRSSSYTTTNFCENGNLITLSECKVKEESDDEKEISNSKSKSISNSPRSYHKEEQLVLAFPDEIEGTIYYEAVDTQNINTKISTSNMLVDNSHHQASHNSFSFDNTGLDIDQDQESSKRDKEEEHVTHFNEKEIKEIGVDNDDDMLQNNFYDKAYEKKRNNLPAIRTNYRTSVWSTLKDSIGKEFSKMKVPVFYREPLSFLQRHCENFQYSDLLNIAAYEERSYMRLSLVAAFVLGGFAFSSQRLFKPFNPILGETYEYVDNNLKFRFFAEQVSVEPPVSACHAEGDGFKFCQSTKINSKFQIKKDFLEIASQGESQIFFTNFDELISFTKPKTFLKNFIHMNEKIQVGAFGKFEVFNNKTREICEIEVNEGKFEGVIKHADDVEGKIKAKIEGNVQSHFNVLVMNGNIWETVCEYKNFINEEIEKYFFNDFIINLNNLNEDLLEVLPESDSRFRKDMRAIESENFQLAIKENEKLEENQKSIVKDYIAKKLVHEPKYFKKLFNQERGEVNYIYSRDYWVDRKNKKFEEKFP